MSIKQYFENENAFDYITALTEDSIPKGNNYIKSRIMTINEKVTNNYKFNVNNIFGINNTKQNKFILISNPIYNYINSKIASHLSVGYTGLNITVRECGKQFENMYAKAKIFGGILCNNDELFIVVYNNEATIYTNKKIELGEGNEYAPILPNKVIFENEVTANRNELEQIMKDNMHLFETKQAEMFIKAQELLNRVSGKNDTYKNSLHVSTKLVYNTIVKNNLLYDGKDSNKSIDDMLNEIFIEIQFRRIVHFAKEYYKKNRRLLKKIQFSFESNVMHFNTRVTSKNCFVNLGVLTLDTKHVNGNKYINGSSITKLIDKTINWFSEHKINLEVTVKVRVLDTSWNRRELSTYVENYNSIKGFLETVEFRQQPNVERTVYVNNFLYTKLGNTF